MASIATFINSMTNIVYELDDREIYNDVRSQIGVTTSETENVIDVPEEKDQSTVSAYVGVFQPNVLVTKRLYPTYTVLAVLSVSIESVKETKIYGLTKAQCEAYDGDFDPDYCYSGVCVASKCFIDYEAEGYLSASLSGWGSNYIDVDILQTGPYKVSANDLKVRATYRYISQGEVSYEQTTSSQETLVVRSFDQESVYKYGRRVMNLTWPMGATQEQMQSIVQAYCNRYSEPVARVKMTVLGRDDALKEQILTRKISEQITVVNTELGLNGDFFINNIRFQDSVRGVPSVLWTLEAIRTTEANGVWVLGTSTLGNSTILAF